MKTALISLILAGGFVGSSHALEAVAQSPVGGGSATSGANLANDAKISAVNAKTTVLVQKVTNLETEIKHFTDCATAGQLWDGTACVPISGTPGANGRDGKDGKDVTLPNCTVSQTLVVRDGALACADASSTDNSAQGTLCGLAALDGLQSNVYFGLGEITTVSSIASLAPCQGQAVASKGERVGVGVRGAARLRTNCPTGYSFSAGCSGGGGGGAWGSNPNGEPMGQIGSASPACFGACVKK